MLIKDERFKKSLLEALADEQCSKLIASTINKAKSVMDIIRECGIPHTSAYRLVNELKERGLLAVERMIISEDGKKYALYRSTFRTVSVRFEGSNIEVEASPNEDVINKTFRLFYSLMGKEEKD